MPRTSFHRSGFSHLPGSVLSLSLALLLVTAPLASAQSRQQDGVRPIPRGVLGGVELTAEEQAVQPIVERLSLESYTQLVHGRVRRP